MNNRQNKLKNSETYGNQDATMKIYFVFQFDNELGIYTWIIRPTNYPQKIEELHKIYEIITIKVYHLFSV